jgi:response regulator of citrate/malate metabolism
MPGTPHGRSCWFLSSRPPHPEKFAMLLSSVIADDSLKLQERYAAALGRAKGFRLREIVSSGPELDDCLLRGGIHLVLLDLYLDGWNGLESLRQARIRHPRVDWLILSRGGDPDIVRGCICLGAFDYLIKPFPTERLEMALSAYYQYHEGLTQRTNPWQQDDLDRVTGLRGHFAGKGNEVPKGLQSKILHQVRACLGENARPRSSAEMGAMLGISRSTARRYLEHLAEKGEAAVEYEVSDVGRPVKLYRLRPC